MKIIGTIVRISGVITFILGIILFASDPEIFGRIGGFIASLFLILAGALLFEIGKFVKTL